jgi:Flp pilus assembly protein TadG
MAAKVLLNPHITINSVDLTGQIASVGIAENFDGVDATAFGATARTRLKGLGDHQFTASFHQSYDASSTNATIRPLVGTTTTVTVNPEGSTNSTTNPEYSFTVLVTEWEDVSGSVGDLMTVDVTWPINGEITQATS